MRGDDGSDGGRSLRERWRGGVGVDDLRDLRLRERGRVVVLVLDVSEAGNVDPLGTEGVLDGPERGGDRKSVV